MRRVGPFLILIAPSKLRPSIVPEAKARSNCAAENWAAMMTLLTILPVTETSLGPARFDAPASANSAKGTNAAGNSTRRLSGITMLYPDTEIEPPRLVAGPDFAVALQDGISM